MILKKSFRKFLTKLRKSPRRSSTIKPTKQKTSFVINPSFQPEPDDPFDDFTFVNHDLLKQKTRDVARRAQQQRDNTRYNGGLRSLRRKSKINRKRSTSKKTRSLKTRKRKYTKRGGRSKILKRIKRQYSDLKYGLSNMRNRFSRRKSAKHVRSPK